MQNLSYYRGVILLYPPSIVGGVMVSRDMLFFSMHSSIIIEERFCVGLRKISPLSMGVYIFK